MKLRDPKARSRAIKEAQVYIRENKGKLELDNNNKAWNKEMDEIFFSRKRKGLAAMMPQGSPIYFEFEGFLFFFSLSFFQLKILIYIGWIWKKKDNILFTHNVL